MKPPFPAERQCRHVDQRCSIVRLPTELLVTILLLVLPSIGAVNNRKQCQEYMTHLYALRSVSKQWRRAIDGTPILWRLISSTLPVRVNTTSVSRSLNTPLVVIYDLPPRDKNSSDGLYTHGELQSAISSAQDFTEWADPVRHRWSSVTFRLDVSVASNVLARPAPQLQSLTILLYGMSLAAIPQINLFGGCTKKIRHVKIGQSWFQYYGAGRIPMFWPGGAFQGLKSLHLGFVCGTSLTTRYILEVLGASPELETLILDGNMIQGNPGDTELPQVILPCLQTLQYTSNEAVGLDQTLRHVTLLPDTVENLSVSDHGVFWEHTSDEFLTTVLSPLIPVLGRLHERCRGSFLSLDPSTHRSKVRVSWVGQLKDLKLKLSLPALSPSTALQWVDRVVGLARPGITLVVPGQHLGEETVSAMQSMQRVEKLVVYGCSLNGLPRVQRLLDALGESNSASPGSASAATFPTLHTLKIAGWEMKLDPIIKMLRTRFSPASDQDTADRAPDLSLDLSLWDWVSGRDCGTDSIWSLELVQEVKAMPGVRKVRLGNVSNRFRVGLLAVVWDEELMTPVWG